MENGRTSQGDSQEFVITLLAIFGRQHGKPLWAGGLVQLLNEAGYTTAAARAALSRLVGRSLLARVRAGRLVYYEITPRCAELLSEGDRRLFTLGTRTEWDGAWTMVWHALPESRALERNRLGRRLRFLGFRPVQDSIWLSPNARGREVQNVAVSIGVTDLVGVLIGTSPGDMPVNRLAERAWDLEDLCDRYAQFAAEFGTSRDSAAALSGRDAFLIRARAAHAFRQFAYLDPEVPDRLLPDPSARHYAAEAFQQIMTELEPPARQYFSTAMSGCGAAAPSSG